MLPQLERLTILERTGHMAPLERPAAVTGALLELSARVRTARQPSRAGR
jgi:pimeloyl-ACP methyl ester carboxylesterase